MAVSSVAIPLPLNTSTNMSSPEPYYWNNTTPFKQSFKCAYIRTITLGNGTIVILESQEQQDAIASLCRSRTVMTEVFFWLAIALGIPGNISAFATLVSMPKSTCTFYIALLSVLDHCSIVMKMTMTLLGRNGVRLGDVGCKILTMTTNFVVTYANWVLVLICLERFVTIRFPLKKPIYLTVKRAWYSAIALGCFLFPFFSVVLVLYQESSSPLRSCQTRPDLQKLTKIWRKVITIIYSFLPAILLFVLVGLITLALRQHKKRRESIWGDCHDEISHRVPNGRNAVHNHSQIQRRQIDRLERSMTGMSLVAAIVFVVFTLPICVLMFMQYDMETTSPESFVRTLIYVAAARALIFMSHAINCYIYFMTCKKFRRHLFGGLSKIFLKLQGRNKSPATTRIQITETTSLDCH